MKVCIEIKPGMCLKDGDGDLSVVTGATEGRVDVLILGNISEDKDDKAQQYPRRYYFSSWEIGNRSVEIISPEELERLLED